ncbi:MAG: diguanylate cyclase [Anaerolineales bacterium]|nr:diguanylate cyclase [Anaerolineales bacterium]
MNKTEAELNKLKSAQSSPDEIQKLIEQAEQNQSIRPEKSIQLCERVIETLKANPELSPRLRADLSKTYLIQGNTYDNICDHQNALQAFLYSLEAVEADQKLYAVGERLIQIAKTHTHLKNYSEALSDIYRALSIAQQIEDKYLEGQALNTLGMVYLDLSEPFKGLSYIQQGHDILEESENPENIEITYLNFCQAYLKMGVLDKALDFSKKAVQIYQKDGEYKQMTISLIYLGEVYYAREEAQKAMEAFQKALEISRKFNYQCESSTALCKLGEILLDQKKYTQAQKYVEESLRLTKEFSQHPNYSECHRLLAEMFSQQKKYQQALKHHELYHSSMSQRYQRDLASRVKVLEMANNLETANKISEALQEQNHALREEIRLRKQAQAELEQISRLDGLTGIYNRRYFFELAAREYARSQRYGHPLSAIMIDLDHFKIINDTHGHAVGDQVLVEVAQRVKAAVREVDIVGRYGGEEFVVLLPETELEAAKVLAKRIWHQLTDRPTITSKLLIPINASIGVATYEPDTKITLDTLIDQADQALYKAKELGRNRIEAFPFS